LPIIDRHRDEGGDQENADDRDLVSGGHEAWRGRSTAVES
jgi:hypothetical protein